MAEQNQTANKESVVAIYDQVCTSYGRIDDFRAKLLGLLPLFAGVGIFSLVRKKDEGFPTEALVAAGAFGAVVTIGLLFYELRGVQRCIGLATLGKSLERKMKVSGQFVCWPHSIGRFINEPLAAGFVYSAVLAAWSWVGTYAWPCVASLLPPSLFLLSFLAVWLFYRHVRPADAKEPTLEDDCR